MGALGGVGDGVGSRVVKRETLSEARDFEQATHRPVRRYDEQSLPCSLELAGTLEDRSEGS